MSCIDDNHRLFHEETDRHMRAVALLLQTLHMAEHLVNISRKEDLTRLAHLGSKLSKTVLTWQAAIREAKDKGEEFEVPTQLTVARDLNRIDLNRLFGNSGNALALLQCAQTMRTRAQMAKVAFQNRGLLPRRGRQPCSSCKRPRARYTCPCVEIKHLRNAYCDRYGQLKDWDLHRVECKERRQQWYPQCS
jgi:hypothetical protein